MIEEWTSTLHPIVANANTFQSSWTVKHVILEREYANFWYLTAKLFKVEIFTSESFSTYITLVFLEEHIWDILHELNSIWDFFSIPFE